MKLRLPTKAGHDKLVHLLSDNVKAVFKQENFFFDGEKGELSGNRCIMRLRFFNVDEKAVLTVKGKMIVSEGVGRAEEEEAEVDVKLARSEYLQDPSEILKLDIPPVQAAKLCALPRAPSFVMC